MRIHQLQETVFFLPGVRVPFSVIVGAVLAIAFIVFVIWLILKVFVEGLTLLTKKEEPQPYSQEWLWRQEQQEKEEEDRRAQLQEVFKSNREVSLQEYMYLRGTMGDDVPGVYILHNTTKEMYYVGQSSHVNRRVMQHFNGNGNADVYADNKAGDEFRVRIVKLVGSGYESLDALERDMIAKYDALETGYNKTAGNSVG